MNTKFIHIYSKTYNILTIDIGRIALYNDLEKITMSKLNVKSMILAAAFLAFTSSSFAGSIDLSHGNNNVDFQMQNLHGKWLFSNSKFANGNETENDCLQSTMSYEKYGRPYFCNDTVKDEKGTVAGVSLYMPTDVYFEPQDPYTLIQVHYTLVDGTELTRKYIVMKMIDYGHDNLVQFIAAQHVIDFIYYTPIARRLDITYNLSKDKSMTFSIINPMFDKKGHLTKNYKIDE